MNHRLRQIRKFYTLSPSRQAILAHNELLKFALTAKSCGQYKENSNYRKENFGHASWMRKEN